MTEEGDAEASSLVSGLIADSAFPCGVGKIAGESW